MGDTTLREAIERLAEDWDRPGMVGIAPRLRAILAEHPATPTEVAVEEWDGGAWLPIIHAASPGTPTLTCGKIAAAVAREHVALTAEAKAEAWDEALVAVAEERGSFGIARRNPYREAR